MRNLPGAIRLIVSCVAFYFVVHWGLDAARILTSPVYGLDDPAFAQIIHGIARIVPLSPDWMLRCAAIFGALKLSVAVVFALYLADRVRGRSGRGLNHELLDAALVLVVLSIFASALPVFTDAQHLLAQYRVPLWLASLAATLSMIERAADETKASRVITAEREIADIRKPVAMQPPARRNVSALRWNLLRKDANIAA